MLYGGDGFIFTTLCIFTVIDENILKNFGGFNKNNLNSIIQSNFSDNDEHDFILDDIKTSSYYEINQIMEAYNSHKHNFSMLSLNCQSINAKFDSLILLVETLRQQKFEFSIICLQETWLEEGADVSLFQIPGYDCIAKGKYRSVHGGLITYVHNNYKYEICNTMVSSDLWEGLLLKIKIQNNSNIYIYNIYRPPYYFSNDNMTDFISQINTTKSRLNLSKSQMFLLGDFNIDLLKIKENSVFKEYLDHMLSFGLSPSITLPTRITDTTATLIDNIFTNNNNSNTNNKNNNNLAGILLSDISDHFPYFYMFNNSKIVRDSIKKYFYIRKSDDFSVQNIIQFLETSDIMTQLNNNPESDPNLNYNILETIITEALDKYMPLKKIKLHKHKHKKTEWITAGIIKSIKFRDNLYKRMKQSTNNTPEYIQLKHNLSVYNKILKRTIRNAKFKYYYSKFDKCRSDSGKTWKTINEVLSSSVSSKFPDYIINNNQCITDKVKMANYFNQYFSKIGTKMASSIPISDDLDFTNIFKRKYSYNF